MCVSSESQSDSESAFDWPFRVVRPIPIHECSEINCKRTKSLSFSSGRLCLNGKCRGCSLYFISFAHQESRVRLQSVLRIVTVSYSVLLYSVLQCAYSYWRGAYTKQVYTAYSEVACRSVLRLRSLYFLWEDLLFFPYMSSFNHYAIRNLIVFKTNGRNVYSM